VSTRRRSTAARRRTSPDELAAELLAAPTPTSRSSTVDTGAAGRGATPRSTRSRASSASSCPTAGRTASTKLTVAEKVAALEAAGQDARGRAKPRSPATIPNEGVTSNGSPVRNRRGPADGVRRARRHGVPGGERGAPGSWFKLGTSGTKNYDEKGVTVSHSETLGTFTPGRRHRARKVFRSAEEFLIDFELVDLTIEQYAKILNDATVTTTVGPPAIKDINLLQGLTVKTFALLARGVSPVNDTLPAQYQVPIVYEAESPSPVYSKGARPARLPVRRRSRTRRSATRRAKAAGCGSAACTISATACFPCGSGVCTRTASHTSFSSGRSRMVWRSIISAATRGVSTPSTLSRLRTPRTSSAAKRRRRTTRARRIGFVGTRFNRRTRNVVKATGARMCRRCVKERATA
jgi:hypothetical protein